MDIPPWLSTIAQATKDRSSAVSVFVINLDVKSVLHNSLSLLKRPWNHIVFHWSGRNARHEAVVDRNLQHPSLGELTGITGRGRCMPVMRSTGIDGRKGRPPSSSGYSGSPNTSGHRTDFVRRSSSDRPTVPELATSGAVWSGLLCPR